MESETAGNGTSSEMISSEEIDPDELISPGACLFDGKVYVSAQQIPREDPCDFCFCFRSDIICLQQSCPPPIPGCVEETIAGFCCPRYECPVLQVTHNITYHDDDLPSASALVAGGATGLPRASLLANTSQVEVQGCEISGEFYQRGQIVLPASGPCLECRCGVGGMMACDPRECQPEPTLRKVMALAGTRRRRHIAEDGSIWLGYRRS